MNEQDDMHPMPHVAEAPDVHAEEEVPTKTRRERNDETVEKWRANLLAQKTHWASWTAYAFFCVMALVASWTLAAHDQPMAGVCLLLVATAIAALGYHSMRRTDLALMRMATLTPVMDPKILGGEIAIVLAATDTMLKTFANPNAGLPIRRLSVMGVMSSSQRLMNRAGVTVETATVDGYPPYPEIDRTEMPGNAGDIETVHLLRIDASAKRMARIADETHGGGQWLFNETFAVMAGEVVPPARALLAALDEREAAIGASAEGGPDRKRPST
jgi:hypothetical protein